MNETPEVIGRVRDRIRAMKPYVVKEVGGEVVCMDKNENPYELPAPLKERILARMAEMDWGRYPPIVATDLHESIARYTGWRPDGVVAGNGSDELILFAFLTFLEPGRKVVIPSPSFAMFSYFAGLVGAEVVPVPLGEDFTYDPDAVERAFLAGGDLLVICTPNNPTGGLYPPDRLEALLAKTGKPVIVDEAYYEFSRVTAAGLLEKYPNLIIFRTFSKAFSLAGQRIGYALASPAMATELLKAKIPFNLDLFSILAARTLLEDPSVVDEAIALILAERDRLMAAMQAIPGVTVYPTAANFILFRTTRDPGELAGEILEEGILVRDLSAAPALAGTLRVTTSRPEDNDRFIQALTKAMV